MESSLSKKSHLIEMEKMLDRYHNPHLLSIGFIVDRNESPHHNRFLNINKSPQVLSKIERIKSPSIKGYSPRGEMLNVVKANCAESCYDANLDAVMHNAGKNVLIDFKKTTARKDQLNGSGFQGFIDSTKV
jgi:hypothetical protein